MTIMSKELVKNMGIENDVCEIDGDIYCVNLFCAENNAACANFTMKKGRKHYNPDVQYHTKKQLEDVDGECQMYVYEGLHIKEVSDIKSLIPAIGSFYTWAD